MTSDDQVAYLSFATDASYPLDQTLTSSLPRAKSAIKATQISADGTQYTNIGDALFRAGQELATLRHESASKSVVVLLTDGDPTYPKDPNDENYPVTYARQRAEELRMSGVQVYTIGLGADVRGDLLSDLATQPDFYYPAASRKDLGEIYGAIATSICKKNPPVFEIIPRVNIYSVAAGSRQ
jgi:Mg-chelatase subunit ChlD